MHNQPRYKPFAATEFFGDRRSARPLIQGTVARGDLREDPHFFLGKVNGVFVTALPMPLTRQLLAHGQTRFNIYCSPCHGRLGNGEGMVAQRGFKHPPSFHEDRLRGEPLGYYFDVITNGFGVMPSYASRIPVADRWAIVAYVRALQLSQNAKLDDVPAAQRQQLAEMGQ
jgi:mono/diheme cytochrome c family protein